MKCKLLIVIAIAMAFAVTSCIKDEGKTIVFLGDESWVVPLEDIIPDEMLNEYYSFFGDGSIPSGDCPPDVEGKYLMDHLMLVWTTDSNNSHYDHVQGGTPFEYPRPQNDTLKNARKLKFATQNNKVCSYRGLQATTDSRSDTVYIMGNNNDFTLYFAADEESEWDWAKVKVLVTGTITPDGIQDLRYCRWMVEDIIKPEYIINGDTLYKPAKPNTVCFFEEKTGLSKRYDWE